MKTEVYKKALYMGAVAVIVMIAAALLSSGAILAAGNQPKNNISNSNYSASSCPDLVITDIWNEGSKIYYEIENIGSATASKSYSALFIDGRLKRHDDVKSLASGASSIESFSYRWRCTSSEDDNRSMCRPR